MKKLMIAAAIVCAAAMSQAANVSWTLNTVKENNVALTQGSYYMFFAESTTALDTIRQNLIAAEGKKSSIMDILDDANWSGVKKATKAGAFNMDTTEAAGSQVRPLSGDIGLANSKTYYAMAVIFDTQNGDNVLITDASKFMISSTTATGTVIPTAADGEAAFSLGGQSTASANWYAVANVPEPTSAMLLLLGVAGLALKRKRA